MASDLSDLVKKLSTRDYAPSDRDALLQRVVATEGLRARDVMWLLFRPDRAAREAAVKALQRAKDPQTLETFVAESRGKPDAAVRAAVLAIPSLGIAGIEARLARTAEFFSYPNGDADERTLAGVRRHYRAAVRYQSASATDPHQIACTHLPRGVLSLAWDVNHP